MPIKSWKSLIFLEFFWENLLESFFEFFFENFLKLFLKTFFEKMLKIVEFFFELFWKNFLENYSEKIVLHSLTFRDIPMKFYFICYPESSKAGFCCFWRSICCFLTQYLLFWRSLCCFLWRSVLFCDVFCVVRRLSGFRRIKKCFEFVGWVQTMMNVVCKKRLQAI